MHPNAERVTKRFATLNQGLAYCITVAGLEDRVNRCFEVEQVKTRNASGIPRFSRLGSGAYNRYYRY